MIGRSVFSALIINELIVCIFCFCLEEIMVDMGYTADEITESLQLHRYNKVFATYHLLGIKSSVSLNQHFTDFCSYSSFSVITLITITIQQ